MVGECGPRFTAEMRLAVTPAQAQELERRFDAARKIYNATLSAWTQPAGRMAWHSPWCSIGRRLTGEA